MNDQRIQNATRAMLRGMAEELERRIRRGCTGCGAPLMELRQDGTVLRVIPSSRVIEKPWQEQRGFEDSIGKPYCGVCLYRMGLACMPGDDYVI